MEPWKRSVFPSEAVLILWKSEDVFMYLDVTHLKG